MAKDKFSDHLRRLSRAQAASLVDHPQAEELLAYHEGQLGDVRAEQIQAHLALCPDCAGTILDLSNFPGVELRVSGHERTEADQEVDWLAVEERLACELPNSQPEVDFSAERPPIGSPSKFPPSSKPTFWPMVVAAVFLATTVGLLAPRLYLVPEPAGKELGTPTANVHFAELLPIDEPDTRSGTTPQIALPAQASSLVLILALGDFQHHATYQAMIKGGAGGQTWRVQGLTPAKDGSFSINLPRSVLTTGSYGLELAALERGTLIKVARYHFDLELE